CVARVCASACYGVHPGCHSFPTRRSSDLGRCRDELRLKRIEFSLFGCLIVFLGLSLKVASKLPRCVQTRRDQASELCAASNRPLDRKSTRLNSSHVQSSYAVFCLKKKSHA